MKRFFSNWRCVLLLVMTMVSFILLTCESDNFRHFVVTKAIIAFVLAVSTYLLYEDWRDNGKLNE